ncbi:MAG TPA: hypothetical protein P5082_12350 [Treponema sp.]|nr:hypothetical protein [Treponema sp.]
MEKKRLIKILTLIVFGSLVVSSIYVIIRMVMVAFGIPLPGDRTENDYILMLLQCMLGIFMMLLPDLISKGVNIQVPNFMHIAYIIFLYCAIYLGEVRNFYNEVPNWDTVMHTFSGGMLGALGFSVVVILNRAERVPVNLSPVFVALFAFCFALTLGVFWEYYEYFFDGIFHINMQKYALPDGTPLTGHDALTDTMKDLFVDALGAFVTSAVGYISLKYQKGWVEKVQVKVQRKKKQK